LLEFSDMDLDLAQLREMHTRLPADLALVLVGRAALALERNGHTSGVPVSQDLEKIVSSGILSWPGAELSKIDQHDHNQITEDGAEAVMLAVAHRHRAWCVVRRLQREEHADWLLEDTAGRQRQVVALEVSGVDRGRIVARLTQKLAQVAKSVDVDQRWAGVVGFEKPITALHSSKRRKRAN
jgi:hypothetical protein